VVTTVTGGPGARRLNHVEMVYRTGERALAARVFGLLGLRVVDHGGTWVSALVDPAIADLINNACYASEVTPEQAALEEALTEAINGVGGQPNPRDVGSAARAYLARLRSEPQRSFHFGIRFFERDDFDATLERVRAAATDPALGGRVTVAGVFRPDDPGTYAPNMIQAFVHTDVVAAGILAFGQHIELQWHLPDSPAGRGR
jgi:hypothetical protein